MSDKMIKANELIKQAVKIVKQNYDGFSDLSKYLSEGQWEEWVRNHFEACIYLTGGKTLSGDKK